MKQFTTRRIILLLFSGLLIVLIVLVLVTSHMSSQKTNIFLHSNAAQLRKGAKDIIALKRLGIEQGVVDYAHWDEFVSYMEAGNDIWAEHFLPPILSNYGTNGFKVYTLDMEVRYSNISPNYPVLNDLKLPSYFLDSLSNRGYFKDIVLLNDNLVELFGSTIQHTISEKGSRHFYGYFVVAKIWNGDFTREIAGIVGGRVALCHTSKRLTLNSKEGTTQVTIPLTNAVGDTINYLCVNKNFPFLSEYNRYTMNLIIIIVVFSVIIMWALFFIISHWITHPLRIVEQAIDEEDIAKAQLLSRYGHDFQRIGESLSSYLEQKKTLIKLKDKAEESDRLKSAFLSNMSHQIRTPLNGILGFTELLRKRIPTDESSQRYGEIINGCSRDLIKIVSDLIDIAKLEAGQFSLNVTKFTLGTAFSNLELLYPLSKPSPDVKIVITHPSVETSVYADMVKVQQVIYNLLDNAIKFTLEGEVEASWGVQGNDLVFYVKDTGIGISVKEQTRVFTRFSQLYSKEEKQFSGAGLGLAISKALVEMMGGKLWFDSIEGKGSTFYFSLPIGNH